MKTIKMLILGQVRLRKVIRVRPRRVRVPGPPGARNRIQ